MTDLWLMVALVVALLLGNLWLLKRNRKHLAPRKTTVNRPAPQTQTTAAVQTSPIVVTTHEKNGNDSPAAKSANDAGGHSSGHSDGGAD